MLDILVGRKGDHNSLDEELVSLLKSGDDRFFELLFENYYSSLCSYATVFVKSHDLSEDIVQETIINIWEQHETIEITGSFRSYFFRCVHNNCVNNLRKTESYKKLQDRFAKQVIQQQEIASMNADPEALENLFREDTEKKYMDALNSLPAQCRKIFLMSRFDCLDYEHIAENLNISVNTVKTQMKRALAKLRDAIKK